jgi:hypothetical protein
MEGDTTAQPPYAPPARFHGTGPPCWIRCPGRGQRSAGVCPHRLCIPAHRSAGQRRSAAQGGAGRVPHPAPIPCAPQRTAAHESARMGAEGHGDRGGQGVSPSLPLPPCATQRTQARASETLLQTRAAIWCICTGCAPLSEAMSQMRAIGGLLSGSIWGSSPDARGTATKNRLGWAFSRNFPRCAGDRPRGTEGQPRTGTALKPLDA